MAIATGNTIELRELARVFKALSDDTRLRIMQYLIVEGRHCVREISEALDISQTATSRNLGILRDTGFLRDERDGACIFYELTDKNEQLIEFLKDSL